jgi:hypothetical protein
MNGIGGRWLRAAVFGTIFMALGSLLIVGVHAQTRGNMREVLQQTAGRIKSDEQMQALNEIMTRGLMLSVGGFGMVLLGIVLAVMGLAGFAISRQKARVEGAALGLGSTGGAGEREGESINGP